MPKLLYGVMRCLLLIAMFESGLGCCSFRYRVAATDVKDFGYNISTKYRYSCALVDDGLPRGLSHITAATLSEFNSYLEKHCPNVFSSHGMPFYFANGSSRYNTKVSWTRILAVLTGSLIPDINYRTITIQYNVGMVEDSGVRCCLGMQETFDSACGNFPTAWLVFCGESESKGNRNYSLLEKGVGKTPDCYDYRETNLERFMRQHVLAYAVAARLKEMEDSGKIDEMLKRLQEGHAPRYQIKAFARDKASHYKYIYAIELDAAPTDTECAFNMVLEDLGKSVKEEYKETYPDVNAESLVLDFSDRRIEGKRIEGSVAVLAITPVALAYDPYTRRGKLSVQFVANQREQAKTWILKNIATLASYKNIALVTGEIPPEARCTPCKESYKDGNVLEIEFMTE